jgi:hypothetical protein
MSTQASWLQLPKAVARTFFVAEGIDGAFQCKTNRGQLDIWHRSPKNILAPNNTQIVRTLSPDVEEEQQLIELARQDPRHAIAAYLDIEVDDLQPEECPDSTKPGYQSVSKRFSAMSQTA